MSSTGFAYPHLFGKGLPAPAARWAGNAKYNFIGGHNDRSLIPVEGLIEATAAVLRREGADLALYSLAQGPQGYLGLRQFVADKLARFSDHFQPKIVGELNGQHVKLVKFQGEFVWHSHDAEDEMFLVLQGAFDMQFRDKTVRIGEGEFLVVPRGVEHCPKADAEVSLMLFEPAGTVNTGTAGTLVGVPT